MSSLRTKALNNRLDELQTSVNLILREEIDREVMQAAIQTIKKLQSIDLSALPTLDKARDNVLGVVTRMLAGDRKSLKQRLLGMFSDENTAIYDALAFGSALQTFFTNFNQYIMAIASKNRTTPNDAMRVIDVTGEYVMQDSIRRFVANNLKPKSAGIFSKYGKGWAKHIDDVDELVQEIMVLPLGKLKTIIQGTNSIASSAQQTASAIQHSSPDATSAEPSELEKEDMPVGPVNWKDIWQQIKDEVGQIDKSQHGVVIRVLKALEKEGFINKK